MGVWALPNANSLDVIKKCRAEMDAIQKELPTGLTARVAYDATKYISDALHEVVKTLIMTLSIVVGGDLPVPRLVPVGVDSAGGDSAFADRRGIPDAGLRFHA